MAKAKLRQTRTVRRRRRRSEAGTAQDDMLMMLLLIGGGMLAWYYLRPRTAAALPTPSRTNRRLTLEPTQIQYGARTPTTPGAVIPPAPPPAPAPRPGATTTNGMSYLPPGTDRRNPIYIKWVQAGLNIVMNAGLIVDGIQGPLTTGAIRQFQAAAGLSVDGIVGPITEEVLSRLLMEKLGIVSVYEGEY